MKYYIDSVVHTCIAGSYLVLLLASICIATPTYAVLDHEIDRDNEIAADVLMKSVEQLQSQQRATLQAIDRATQLNETTAKQNTAVLNAFLDHIEQVINLQNKRNEANLRMSHRLAVVVSIICVFGVMCILAWTLIILRTIHRRFPTEPIQSLLPPGEEYKAALSDSIDRQSRLMSSNPADEENKRLETAVTSMENRIDSLEALSTSDKKTTSLQSDPNQSISEHALDNGNATAPATQPESPKKSANHNKQRPTGVDLKQVKTTSRILG